MFHSHDDTVFLNLVVFLGCYRQCSPSEHVKNKGTTLHPVPSCTHTEVVF